MSNTTLTIDRVGRCSNRQCTKNNCARHHKNHNGRIESQDLYQPKAGLCANYLAKYTVARVEDGNFLVRKQK